MIHLEYIDMLRLRCALARIVDERGTAEDWRAICAYRVKLGEDVVLKAAQDAALKLRASRVDSSHSRQPRTHKPRRGISPLDTP
jgi:hypothetical protein